MHVGLLLESLRLPSNLLKTDWFEMIEIDNLKMPAQTAVSTNANTSGKEFQFEIHKPSKDCKRPALQHYNFHKTGGWQLENSWECNLVIFLILALPGVLLAIPTYYWPSSSAFQIKPIVNYYIIYRHSCNLKIDGKTLEQQLGTTWNTLNTLGCHLNVTWVALGWLVIDYWRSVTLLCGQYMAIYKL